MLPPHPLVREETYIRIAPPQNIRIDQPHQQEDRIKNPSVTMRPYAVSIRNYQQPFPPKWIQILQAAHVLNMVEYPGDENGPVAIAQLPDISYTCDVFEGIRELKIPLQHPTIRIHDKPGEFEEVAEAILYDLLNGALGKSERSRSLPFSDADARVNVTDSQ